MILNSKTPAAAAASILRVILGAIFMYAAWTKLREPWALFAISIDSYQVLPLWAVEFIARTLPWLELLLGALLIAGIWRGVAAAAANPVAWRILRADDTGDGQGHADRLRLFRIWGAPAWMTLLREGAPLASSLFVTSMAFRRS